MKPVKVLLARVLFANLFRLVVGMGNSTNSTTPNTYPGPPGCVSRCMVGSMLVTQCADTKCLSYDMESLFQCLYSQCDSNHYGPALSHVISLCMNPGAKIYTLAPGSVDIELLRPREGDYLASREVANVPGMQLRQASVVEYGETTAVTTMIKAVVTVSIPPVTVPRTPQTPTSYFETALTSLAATTSASRPWAIRATRMDPSYFGLVVWVMVVVGMDYWVNGYWG